MNWKIFLRQVHYWLSALIVIQFIIIVGSGSFLLLKKQFSWIQPPTQVGSADTPTVSFDRILEIARSVAVAEITDWNDIDRLDVRPTKGMLKIRAKNGWEIQVDTSTGDVLQTSYRRSDFIESIHDGTYFHENMKLWVFFPTAIILIIIWCTGVYLFVLPFWMKAKKRRKMRCAQSG